MARSTLDAPGTERRRAERRRPRGAPPRKRPRGLGGQADRLRLRRVMAASFSAELRLRGCRRERENILARRSARQPSSRRPDLEALGHTRGALLRSRDMIPAAFDEDASIGRDAAARRPTRGRRASRRGPPRGLGGADGAARASSRRLSTHAEAIHRYSLFVLGDHGRDLRGRLQAARLSPSCGSAAGRATTRRAAAGLRQQPGRARLDGDPGPHRRRARSWRPRGRSTTIAGRAEAAGRARGHRRRPPVVVGDPLSRARRSSPPTSCTFR